DIEEHMVEDFNFTLAIIALAAAAYAISYAAPYYFGNASGWIFSHNMLWLRERSRRRFADNTAKIAGVATAVTSLFLFAINHQRVVDGLLVSAAGGLLVAMSTWLAISLAGRKAFAPMAVAYFAYIYGSHMHEQNVLIGAMFGIFIGACVVTTLSLVAFALSTL